MSISELLLQGVNLMLLGMGMVFIFLTILVIAMNLMSRLAQAISGPEISDVGSQPAMTPKPSTEGDDLVAVISAAISRFRSR